VSFFTRVVEVEKIVDKIVEVEKIVEVVGKASLTSLYRTYPEIDNPDYIPPKLRDGIFSLGNTAYKKKVPGPPKYFHTCEQAHAASGGQPVNKVDFVKIGAKYFQTWGEPVTLPKVSVPKVAK